MASENVAPGDHLEYMRLALSLARKSPPKPTNYCVGAVLVDEASNSILSTGYTLELPGNTHAEQCAFEKYARSREIDGMDLVGALPSDTVLYTTMEPCNERLSGNISCVERILATQLNGKGGIRTVYAGVKEPEKFIGSNLGKNRLEKAGIEFIHVKGLETEILEVATAGHEILS